MHEKHERVETRLSRSLLHFTNTHGAPISTTPTTIRTPPSHDDKPRPRTHRYRASPRYDILFIARGISTEFIAGSSVDTNSRIKAAAEEEIIPDTECSGVDFEETETFRGEGEGEGD